ncbi:Crp/Fnr family transcriptional regulator [Aestuariirhabdus sp. Z084]|uniref:Crp/Fnr family transcriptional regulator n=1 Tax=Aestuariirhabdus haliotis TaxID=2918751 RepID=UPI00201B3CEF|nr:Crp/Fnr family transcriptional regulator [Aestuariirhabdus haliotis]MCL6416481.1 Crp/Fnr family transcriptional regulator [Aestuariirhabdus haliotis]MCL6420471.1 Crp/Fnr family transcriptional regulator [Aestuariirhabdus haliotis]
MPSADAAQLTSSGLFASMDPNLQQSLLKHARHIQLPPSQVLYRRGDKPKGFYGLLSGEIQLTASDSTGKQLLFGTIEAGWWCGEIPALDGEPYAQTATAIVQSELLMIPLTEFDRVLSEHPELYRHFIRILCRRIRLAGQLLEESAFYDLTTRVASQLLRLCRLHRPDATQHLQYSQAQIADMLGITRQSLHRVLKNWQQQGWIELSYASIKIDRPDALRALVQAREVSPNNARAHQRSTV